MAICARHGCGVAVVKGYCSAHQRPTSPKVSAHRRGYTAGWERFRETDFPRLLLDHGIVVQCGARLYAPGPSPHSRCAAAGIVTMDGLELDHEPPLMDVERDDPANVCDPMRVGFLCKGCHTVKTNRERATRATASVDRGTGHRGGGPSLPTETIDGPRGGLFVGFAPVDARCKAAGSP